MKHAIEVVKHSMALTNTIGTHTFCAAVDGHHPNAESIAATSSAVAPDQNRHPTFRLTAHCCYLRSRNSRASSLASFVYSV